MGLWIKIPTKYENPIIIAYLLREKCQSWNHENVKREFLRGNIRDSEVVRQYHRLATAFSSIETFCESKSFTFFVRSNTGLHIFSSGPEIFYDETKRRIFFQKTDLYTVPRGIKNKFSEVNQLLSVMNIPTEDWEKSEWENEQLSFENVLVLEEFFRLKIQIWSRTWSEKENRNFYYNHYTGNKAYSKVCQLHYQTETNFLFLIEDKEQYFDKYFACSTEDCFYTFKSKKLLDQHVMHCGKETIKIIQEELGPSGKLIEKAENANLSTHSLVSIAVNR